MKLNPENKQTYALTIREPLDPRLMAWMDDFDIISQDAEQTVLLGAVKDQSALRNVLEHLWSFNITIVSFFPVEPHFHNTTAQDVNEPIC